MHRERKLEPLVRVAERGVEPGEAFRRQEPVFGRWSIAVVDRADPTEAVRVARRSAAAAAGTAA